MRIDNPSVSGSLSFQGGTNTVAGITANLTGSYTGSFKGDFEGSFSGDTLNNISGAFNDTSASLAEDIDLNHSSITSLNNATSSYLLNTTDTLDGDLTVTGTITAQEFHTEFVSASIIYQSGSTQFGNTSDDIHSFSGTLTNTGNVGIGTSSPSANLHISATGDATILLEADSDNAGTEDDNPVLKFSQDGGGITASIGLNGNVDATFVGATSNGFYINSSEEQMFAIADSIAMYINTSRNVGIGTSNPQEALEIFGSTKNILIQNTLETDSGIIFRDSADAGQSSAIKYGSGDNALKFYNASSNTERMRIDSSGNVGINTISPTHKLHINSGITNVTSTFESGDATAYINVKDSSSGIYGALFGAIGDDILFANGSGAVERMRIDSSGHIDINGGNIVLRNSTLYAPTSGYLKEGFIANNDGILTFAVNGASNGAYGQHSFQIRKGDSSDPIEAMRIASNGNVGIGLTETNSVKLGITGNSGLPATSGTTQTGLLRLKASNNATLDMGADHIYAVGWLQVTDVVDLSNEYNLLLQPNGGNVGIGTTSPTQKLEVVGQTVINGGVGVASSGTLHVRQKGDGSSDGIALTSSNNTSHRIWKDSSGLLNIGPPTLPSAFVQTLAGNVGIGTTSPADLLHLTNGNLRIDGATSNRASISLNEGIPAAGVENVILEYDGTGAGTGNYFSIYSNVFGWNGKGSGFNYVPANGYVGIGTLPATKLHLYESAAAPVLLTLHNYRSDIIPNGTQGNFIDFKMTDDNATFTPQARIGMIVNDSDGDSGVISEGTGNFVIYTGEGTNSTGGGTLTERLRVTDKGNVGINTADLTGTRVSKLVVDGNDVFAGTFSTLGETYNGSSSSARGSIYEPAGTIMRITGTSNGVNAGALISFNAYNSDNGATGAFIGAAAGPTGNEEANIVFGRRTGTASWSESMRIDTGGKVGINTTSPATTLDVNGDFRYNTPHIEQVYANAYTTEGSDRTYKLTTETLAGSGQSAMYFFTIIGYKGYGSMTSYFEYRVHIHRRRTGTLDLMNTRVYKMSDTVDGATFYNYDETSNSDGLYNLYVHIDSTYSGIVVYGSNYNSGVLKSTKDRWSIHATGAGAPTFGTEVTVKKLTWTT